jgi:hypothetical protein
MEGEGHIQRYEIGCCPLSSRLDKIEDLGLHDSNNVGVLG